MRAFSIQYVPPDSAHMNSRPFGGIEYDEFAYHVSFMHPFGTASEARRQSYVATCMVVLLRSPCEPPRSHTRAPRRASDHSSAPGHPAAAHIGYPFSTHTERASSSCNPAVPTSTRSAVDFHLPESDIQRPVCGDERIQSMLLRISDLWWTARPRALAASSARRMLGPAPGTAALRRGRRPAGPLVPPAASGTISTCCPCTTTGHIPPFLLSRRPFSVMQNGTANGHHVARPLVPGIFAPIPTFYQPETEDLDLETLAKHVVRAAKAGVRPLLAGSMGEGVHLTHSERVALIKAARVALDEAGFETMPIIAGTGTGSTRETVELCKEAAAAGADYTIVITSGYFAGVLGSHKKAQKAFFKEVSEKSPIPVIIYNYPGASGGIDLDSDTITELASECPNLCGVKLTCGNVGKLTRICATVSEESFSSSYPRSNPDAPFLVLGGFVDFLLPSSYANAHGAITGLGNFAPYTLVKLYELSVAVHKDSSLLPEAQRLQGIVARADFTIAKAGISGTKALMEKLYGYGGLPRKPLPPIEPEAFEALWAHPHVQDIVKTERELSGKTAS